MRLFIVLAVVPLSVPLIANAYSVNRQKNTGSSKNNGANTSTQKTNTGGNGVAASTTTTTTSGTATSTVPVPATSTPAAVAPVTFAWTKLGLYVDPLNEASAYAKNNPTLPDVQFIKRQGDMSVARWFGDWDSDVRASVAAYVSRAAGANKVPIVVLYNIPNRDCGLYSAGGAASEANYANWLQNAAAGLGDYTALVILEPDALAGADCLSAANKQSRYTMLTNAVATLKSHKNAYVYVDAGNPAWQTVQTMAERLKASGVVEADGFSLNVSNYVTTARNQSYGEQLAKLLGNKHYVIDTSRNGNSEQSPEDWCNSSTAALGHAPTTDTGLVLNDALLWVKRPWESDGSCNGAPEAGMEYWAFAIQMAKNAGW